MKNQTKEQLQKQLKAIAIQEKKELIEKHYPIFQEKYVGKFFKYRNSYDAKRQWWMYKKVTEIKPSDVYDTGGNKFMGWSFQTDPSGNIFIDREDRGYTYNIGEEITEAEFNDAWNKMIETLNSLP